MKTNKITQEKINETIARFTKEFASIENTQQTLKRFQSDLSQELQNIRNYKPTAFNVVAEQEVVKNIAAIDTVANLLMGHKGVLKQKIEKYKNLQGVKGNEK